MLKRRMIIARKKGPSTLKILTLVAVQLLIIGSVLFAYSYFTKSPAQHTLMAQKDKRMETMIETLLPAIKAENEKIQKEKQQLATGDTEAILNLASKYEVDMLEDEIDARIHILEERVDEIPASLLIAYAWVATENGQNKDALERNNYFDDRDWNITLESEEEATYTLKRFTSPTDSVKAFMHKLNTALFFEDFRRVRKTHRGYVGGKMIPSRLADKFVFYQGDNTLDRKIQAVMKEFTLSSRLDN